MSKTAHVGFRSDDQIRDRCKPLPTEATDGLWGNPISSCGRPTTDIVTMMMIHQILMSVTVGPSNTTNLKF